MKVNEIIKQERLKQKLTQLDLANKIGVTKNYITKIEKGSNISIRVLEVISEALECELIVKLKRKK